MEQTALIDGLSATNTVTAASPVATAVITPSESTVMMSSLDDCHISSGEASGGLTVSLSWYV